jgi:adenine phosphoribosyltransferase
MSLEAALDRRVRSALRAIPDYPKPGILFQDITPVLGDAVLLKDVIAGMAQPFAGQGITRVLGIEARGFILGGAVAHGLGAGFVPIRKRGKLPWDTIAYDYELEYGTDRVELHADAVEPGERVLLVDDLIATGGTAEAAVELLTRIGGQVIEAVFVIELDDLEGRPRLERRGIPVFALLHFPGH